MLKLSNLIYLFLISSAIAQELPNLENQILKSDNTRFPKVVVWEKKMNPLVHGTLIIRFSDEQYVSYGPRLPQLFSELWNASIPLQNLSDLVGKKNIQSFDSLTVEYLSKLHQNESNEPFVRNEYFVIQAVLKPKVEAVIANQSVGRKIQFQTPVTIGQSIFIRFQFEPNALDKAVNYIFEKLHNPFWLEHIETYAKVIEGYPVSEYSLLPIRVENSLYDLWSSYLKESEVSVAFVGNLNAVESMTICNLYWSDWNISKKNSAHRRGIDWTSHNSNDLIFPIQNSELVRHWFAQIGVFTYQEKCEILTNSVPFFKLNTEVVQLTINQQEIYRRWLTFITECLSQPSLSADILSISNLSNGWESWYEIDEKMRFFTETPEYFWITNQLNTRLRR